MHMRCAGLRSRTHPRANLYVMSSMYLYGRLDGPAERAAMDEQEQINMIKTRMPSLYKEIQKKAAEKGNQAYALVRKGLRGEPNCFYGFERGHVVGTPFNIPSLHADIAKLMVQFGVDYCCIWPAEVSDGAH